MEADEDRSNATSKKEITAVSEETQSQPCSRQYGDNVEKGESFCLEKTPQTTARVVTDDENVIEILSDAESIDDEKNSGQIISSQGSASSILDRYEPMDIDEILDGIQIDTVSEQETHELADVKEIEIIRKTNNDAQQGGFVDDVSFHDLTNEPSCSEVFAGRNTEHINPDDEVLILDSSDENIDLNDSVTAQSTDNDDVVIIDDEADCMESVQDKGNNLTDTTDIITTELTCMPNDDPTSNDVASDFIDVFELLKENEDLFKKADDGNESVRSKEDKSIPNDIVIDLDDDKHEMHENVAVVESVDVMAQMGAANENSSVNRDEKNEKSVVTETMYEQHNDADALIPEDDSQAVMSENSKLNVTKLALVQGGQEVIEEIDLSDDNEEETKHAEENLTSGEETNDLDSKEEATETLNATERDFVAKVGDPNIETSEEIEKVAHIPEETDLSCSTSKKAGKDSPDDELEIIEDESKVAEDESKSAKNVLKMVEDESKVVGDDSKVVADDSEVAPDDSKVAEDKSKLAKDELKVAEDELKVVEDESKVTENKANIVEDKSKSAEDESKDAINEPKVAEDKPKVAEDKPKVAEDRSKAAEDASKVVEDESKVTENKMKNAEDKSKSAEDESKVALNEPKVAEDESKVVEDKSKVAEDKSKPPTSEFEVGENETEVAKCESQAVNIESKTAEDKSKDAASISGVTEDTPKVTKDNEKLLLDDIPTIDIASDSDSEMEEVKSGPTTEVVSTPILAKEPKEKVNIEESSSTMEITEETSNTKEVAIKKPAIALNTDEEPSTSGETKQKGPIADISIAVSDSDDEDAKIPIDLGCGEVVSPPEGSPEPLNKTCINFNCPKSSTVYFEAPEFVINHFHLSKRLKYMHICEDCFNIVVERYGELCAAIEDKQPLYINKKTKIAIEVIDSSDDEDNVPETKRSKTKFNTETLALIENELEDIINNTFERINMKQQMDWNCQILNAQANLNKDLSSKMAAEIKELEKVANRMYYDTYKSKAHFNEDCVSLDLNTGWPTRIYDDTYPPTGEFVHPEIKINMHFYSYVKRKISAWTPCKIVEIQEHEHEKPSYTIRCLTREKKQPLKAPVERHLDRMQLAYSSAPEYRLNIGARVIALYTDISKSRTITKQAFYPGIICEPLSKYTKYRYLVVFDDGYVQYVYHDSVRLMCENRKDVWELVDEKHTRAFLEDYLNTYRQKRAFVNARMGQRILTELNGRFVSAIVTQIDSSLLEVYFEEPKRNEWIYRGSTRFFTLFKQLKKMPIANRVECVEYITIEDDKEPTKSQEPPNESPTQTQSSIASTSATDAAQGHRTFASQAVRDSPAQQKRAVAKKSSAGAQRPIVQNMNNSTIYVDEDKPKGRVVYYTAKRQLQTQEFTPHECNPQCLMKIKANLKSYSPLSKPLLSGWERQVSKTKMNRKCISYRAPCGRRLRDMKELHRYLRMTDCPLNVDNFEFDPMVYCLAEYVIDSFVMKKTDLSDGAEHMNIQCINCYDNTEPPPCNYSAIRIPNEGVPLNLDPEFLCGCDCEDDCSDKTKCQCWQLTLAGTKYDNPDAPNDKLGYEYKRLYEPVQTGIYECNSRCKCKSNCLNRVVQQPLSLKLQVFKTMNRGWGMRCLNDIPKGAFICCYAGDLLTEQAANEAGQSMGDEYFAELDYIEVMENIKEGYEEEAEVSDENMDDEDFDYSKESNNRNDDSDDEFVSRHYSPSDAIQKSYRTRNSKQKEAISDQKADKEKQSKPQNSSSDEEEGVRQVRNIMANFMNDEEEERSKSFRKLFGKTESVYIMDAMKAGNIGRYFNHSCGPNLFVQNVFVDTHDLRFPWVAFFAMHHIRAGTELTWNYNYEVGSVQGKVLICQCGDIQCRGRIL